MIHPALLSRFGLIARTESMFQQTRIRYCTFAKERETTFMGKCTMTKEELEYMLLCAKETHAKKIGNF